MATLAEQLCQGTIVLPPWLANLSESDRYRKRLRDATQSAISGAPLWEASSIFDDVFRNWATPEPDSC
jgi:hypothetical protein